MFMIGNLDRQTEKTLVTDNIIKCNYIDWGNLKRDGSRSRSNNTGYKFFLEKYSYRLSRKVNMESQKYSLIWLYFKS